MRKRLLNNHGASLIEIVAMLAISSIIFVTISSLLRQNIRQNAITQEKTVNANVATATLNYLQTLDYDLIYDLVYPTDDKSNDAIAYTMIDLNFCNNDYFNAHETDQEICRTSLSPTVNSKTYELKILVLPYNRYEIIENVYEQGFVEITSTPVLYQYLEDLKEQTSSVQPNDSLLRVAIVIESTINNHFDYLLEGVISNEANCIQNNNNCFK
jgi:type II secretory pathway pseudopilin PulG